MQFLTKTLFWHKLTLFVFLNMLKNNIKMRKTVKTPQKMDQFLTQLLDQCLTQKKKPKSWTNFNSTAHAYIYIYMHACRRVIRLSTFGPFRELFDCPPFCQNLILTATRSKLTIIKLAACPLFWRFLAPQSGQTSNFRGGQTNNFQMALCYPIFETIGANFLKTKNRTLIEKQAGTSVDKLRTFINFECYFF